MTATPSQLDDPARFDAIRETINRKSALRQFYCEVYAKYRHCLGQCPPEGLALELGSGGGFARTEVPGILTSDLLPYRGVEQVVDATKMPFGDGELRAILMFDVFHHIPDAEAFLREAERCLKPGGRILIVDQHPGWIGGPVLRWFHHEPYDPHATEWRFHSSGPLSGANGALAWIVFRRDRERLRRLFPRLQLLRYQPHTPLRYWLAGGLKGWTLLPGWCFAAATRLDRWLTAVTVELGSFVDIELVRT